MNRGFVQSRMIFARDSEALRSLSAQVEELMDMLFTRLQNGEVIDGRVVGVHGWEASIDAASLVLGVLLVSDLINGERLIVDKGIKDTVISWASWLSGERNELS